MPFQVSLPRMWLSRTFGPLQTFVSPMTINLVNISTRNPHVKIVHIREMGNTTMMRWNGEIIWKMGDCNGNENMMLHVPMREYSNV